jgi:DNA polymerase epsilon subunit 1
MNPVPRIEYPEWLIKRIKIRNNKFKQKKMENFFKVGAKPDIEDLAKSFPKITVNKINLKTDEKP